jgi:DNA (cytosine-5)-methyltransferase 1
MRVLNLYAGIGGNRRLWEDCEVTAVELDANIAKIYQDQYPNDKVIVGDAHEYLLEHYKEYDFIWASPPCPTHSQLRLLNLNKGTNKLEYPDMRLYQEIIILDKFFEGKYCVENVIGYYTPLIPAQKSGRHYFWANFRIGEKEVKKMSIKEVKGVTSLQARADEYGIDKELLYQYKGDHREKLIKNAVDSELALYIFDCAREIIRKSNTSQTSLFLNENF